MTPTEARYAFADSLALTLGPSYTVYPSPPDAAPPPGSVVISPRPNYLTKGTYCAWEVRVTATVLVAVVSGQPGLDTLDDALTQLYSAVDKCEVPVSMVEQTADIGPVLESQGVRYVSAALDVTLNIT